MPPVEENQLAINGQRRSNLSATNAVFQLLQEALVAFRKSQEWMCNQERASLFSFRAPGRIVEFTPGSPTAG